MSRTLRACLGAILAFALQSPALAGYPSAETAAPPLTLDRALALAEARHPELTAAQEEILAREAELGQAALRPNPTLELELENFAGSGEFSGADAVETTLLLTQPIELGDKRERRRQSAAITLERTRAEQGIVRADLAARTADRFLAVLAAQKRLLLTQSQADLARRSLAAVEDRVAAGQAPATEIHRARLAVIELELEISREEGDLAAARQELAGLLGVREDACVVAGELSPLPGPPPLEELEAGLADSPGQRRQQLLIEERRRELALEESLGKPDLDLSLGGRYFNEDNDGALIAGFSLPLPLFNRNQGKIAAAGHRRNQAQAEAEGRLQTARAALARAWHEAENARWRTEILDQQLLPTAETAFAAAEYGYRAGKFPLFDVLDAQRTLIDLRQRRLAALIDGQQARIEIERLLGRPLAAATSKENDPS
ncbi:MAG: TolC family protein [Trichloromonas sp.]|jgi:cobalt-zinc-cadmium efflux system outer membrane protein|nr:TolC family protein [Trichloromonas sp.]